MKHPGPHDGVIVVDDMLANQDGTWTPYIEWIKMAREKLETVADLERDRMELVLKMQRQANENRSMRDENARLRLQLNDTT